MPEALHSQSWVCSHSIAGIAGSNRADNMDVRPFCLLYVIAAFATRWSFIQRSLTVVCLDLWVSNCVWGTNLDIVVVSAQFGLMHYKTKAGSIVVCNMAAEKIDLHWRDSSLCGNNTKWMLQELCMCVCAHWIYQARIWAVVSTEMQIYLLTVHVLKFISFKHKLSIHHEGIGKWRYSCAILDIRTQRTSGFTLNPAGFVARERTDGG